MMSTNFSFSKPSATHRSHKKTKKKKKKKKKDRYCFM
jgi:hypothetical protein